MTGEILDEHAHICVDCLILHANGDCPPDMSEAEQIAFGQAIGAHLEGRWLTIGWGREEHDCAANVTVTALYRGGDENPPREYRADTVSEAVEKAEFDYPDAHGFRAIMHDLQTEADRGGECDCETDTFRDDWCDSCGRHVAGEYHAATIWKEGE